MSNIESRIDKLERTINELRNELRTLRVLVRTDYPSALNKIRFITEKILGQLCKEHNISWGNAEPTLENMIGPLIAKQVIPRPIAIHVRSIQTNSSPGSHFQETPLSAAHLDIAQMALVEFLEWYYSTHPNPVEVASDGVSKSRAVPASMEGTQPTPTRRKNPWPVVILGVLILAVTPFIYHALFPGPLPPTKNDATQTASSQTAPAPPIVQSPTVYVDPPVTEDTKFIADVCDENESRIQNYVVSNNFLNAIRMVGNYQLNLIKLYPSSTFSRGLFLSPSHQINWKMPDFASWQQEDNAIAGANNDEARSAGFEFLLSIQGTTDKDHVTMGACDYQSMYSKMSVDADPNSDQTLMIFSNQFMGMYGNVSFGKAEQIGDVRVLRVNVANNPAYDVQGASFYHDGLAFGVVCLAAPSDHDTNVARLNSILHAVTFPKNPQTQATVDLIQKQITQPKDPGQLLKAVRRLAMLRQYRRASHELSTLIGVLASDMPRPYIEGDVAIDSTFGVQLKNPDPQKWKLDIQNQGSMNVLSLSDKSASNTHFLGVIMLNPVISFGARVASLTDPNASPDDLKAFLQSAGEGGLINSHVTPDAESFGTFHGLVSYEGQGPLSAFGIIPTQAREKVIVVVRKNDTMLLVMCMGNQQQIEEEQKMLDDILTLNP